MGLLREPVATRSHHSWKNIATRYGRFCVQKRTEEGLYKNTKLRHRFFYLAEDLFPFRIIYSSHPSDFNDSLPASSPLTVTSSGGNGLYPTGFLAAEGRSNSGSISSTNGITATTTTFGSAATAVISSTPSTPSVAESENNDGVVGSLLNWLTGSGEQKEASSPTSFFLFAPFSASASPAERFTVATSSQLSGILESWGLLMAAWEPEEAELNVLSFATPAMASPTTRGGAANIRSSRHTSAATSAAMAAAAARVPFCERWRRAFGRVEVMCAEAGMECSTATTSYDAGEGESGFTPPSPSLNDSTTGFSFADTSPLNSTLPASRVRRGGGGGEGMLSSSLRATREEGKDHAASALATRSFAVRRHVHISDAYYFADSPAALLVAHFLDVLLVRVVDLLMWRDPQLTACCLGILISVYSYSAWASAVCYLGGDALAASSEYCARLYTDAIHHSSFTPVGNKSEGGVQDTLLGERLWWGAPLFMTGVLAYPWTREQQRRALSATDREHLRSVDYALRWLSSAADEEESERSSDAARDTSALLSPTLSTVAAVVEVVRRVGAVLITYRLPIAVLLLFNVIGAFATWEAILVLFLWPTLIVGVGLAGLVVATQCITNR